MHATIQTKPACRVRTEAGQSTLTLHVATAFWRRLLGLHVYPCLPWGTGLHLVPCGAIHTFGLSYPIDVVFLDGFFTEIKCVTAMPPNRMAFCLKAASVIELPAGYCRAHPDYGEAIRQALGLPDEREQ